MNQILSGDYSDKLLVDNVDLYIELGGIFKAKPLYLNKDTVKAYEVINRESAKSATSGVIRGVIGSALLGPVGMLAGVASAKSDDTYIVAIEMRDGKKFLAELESKSYKKLIVECYGLEYVEEASTLNNVVGTSTDTIFCSNCGNKNLSSSKFCSSCGTQIINAVVDSNENASNNIMVIKGFSYELDKLCSEYGDKPFKFVMQLNKISSKHNLNSKESKYLQESAIAYRQAIIDGKVPNIEKVVIK